MSTFLDFHTARIRFALLLLFTLAAPVMDGQTIFIGANQYAFQYQPGGAPTPLGLFFNATASQYEFRDNAGLPELTINPQQKRSNFRGQLGVNAPVPAAAFQVVGTARMGGTANYASIDASGSLRFTGTAGYRVGSNRYAFQAEGSPAGLLFNVSGNAFEFINAAAVPVFRILATGADAGSTSISDDLSVDGNIRAGGIVDQARLSAAAANGSQLAAIGGQGLNDLTKGYLGVLGDPDVDGTGLDLGGDEIGVLGIATGGTLINDNFGVYAYADFVALRAVNENGLAVDLGGQDYALDVAGVSRFSGAIQSDTLETESIWVENVDDAALGARAPLFIGMPSGQRLNLFRNTVQAENGSGPALLEINPFGGNVSIGNGGGNVNIAELGAGNITLGLGGGTVNVSNVIFTDAAAGKASVGDITPDYTWTVRHSPGTTGKNGLAMVNSLTNATWHWYTFVDGDLGLFEGDSLRGVFDNVSGNYTVTSDRRLKTSIRDLDDPTEILLSLRPRSYRFRGRSANVDRRYFGVIAQELETVLPDLVHRDSETGLRSVSYTELIPLLLAGWQADHVLAESERQEKEKTIAALSQQMDAMADRLAVLEALHANASPAMGSPSGEAPGTSANQGLGSSMDQVTLQAVRPNPANTSVRLDYAYPSSWQGSVVVRVYHAQGSVQAEAPLSAASGTLSLETANWPSGMYYVGLYRGQIALQVQPLQIQH